MKKSPKTGGSPRRPDSRAGLVMLAALGLSAVIAVVIIAVAFPDWRPAFLEGTAPEAAVPGQLVVPTPPSGTDAPGGASELVSPTDAAAGRMLFGGPGRAVLGDRVPTAPRSPLGSPAVAPPRSPLATPPGPPCSSETPSAAEQMSFRRYIDWLRTVELERQSLRAWGERRLTAGDPAAPPEPAVRRQELHLAGQEVGAFRQRILRTKPVVPPDCRIVDQYYMGALSYEGSQTAEFVQALEQGAADRVRQLQRGGTGRIDRDLTVANAKLEQTFRKRGQPQELRLEMGADASLLGALITP